MKKLLLAVLCLGLLCSVNYAESTIGIVFDTGGTGDNEVQLSWYHQMDINPRDDIVSYDEYMRDLRALLLAADTDTSGTLTKAEAEASVALTQMVDIQCDVALTWMFWENLRNCTWAQISGDEDMDFMSTTEWFAWINNEQERCVPECPLPSYDDCDDHIYEVEKGNTVKQMITICHVPPGNPDKAHTLDIPYNAGALEAHLAHGDYCGPCAEDHGGSHSQYGQQE